jgi:hypothetical protein|tara:strand:+ start:476 stop:790 length:315 start_codon:yes stop_codon:yes gene_type:complete
MEYTGGFKVVELKIQGETYQGFYKVTRKGVMIIETKTDIPVKPYDQITVGVDKVIVQKIQIYTTRAEITCEAVASSDIVKANKTRKKLEKSETKTEKDTDGESV